MECVARQTQVPTGGVQVLEWPGDRPGCGVPEVGRDWVFTCLEGCNGTFLAPPSQVGSKSCPGLPASTGALFSLGSADGQVSESRGFLKRRRCSHFSFRSCGFRAMSFCRERGRENLSVGWETPWGHVTEGCTPGF